MAGALDALVVADFVLGIENLHAVDVAFGRRRSRSLKRENARGTGLIAEKRLRDSGAVAILGRSGGVVVVAVGVLQAEAGDVRVHDGAVGNEAICDGGFGFGGGVRKSGVRRSREN